MSCATPVNLEVGDFDMIDAGLSLGGHPNVTDFPFGSGGALSAETGGVVGAGGFMPPLGKGGAMSAAGAMPGGRSSMGGRGAVGGSASGGMPLGMGGASRGMGGGVTAAGGIPNCAANEKICGGVCAAPSPKVGCGPTGCDPCSMTAPKNGYITCVSGACAIDCLSGYTKKDGACEGPPPGSGNCPSSAIGCPDCGPVFGPGCCAQNKCGCSPIPWTVGILGCI